MKKIKKIAVLAACAFVLYGCASPNTKTPENVCNQPSPQTPSDHSLAAGVVLIKLKPQYSVKDINLSSGHLLVSIKLIANGGSLYSIIFDGKRIDGEAETIALINTIRKSCAVEYAEPDYLVSTALK